MFLSEQNAGLTPHTLWLADEVGTTDSAKKHVNELFGRASVFDTPKPVELMSRIIQIANAQDGIVLDFFAGSASLAEAAIRIGRRGSNPKFIMVQLPEPCHESSEAFKAGYRTI